LEFSFRLAWWRAHHFIATVATAILLTWPDSQSFYLSFVQVRNKNLKKKIFFVVLGSSILLSTWLSLSITSFG
jgi:hypothetical protein